MVTNVLTSKHVHDLVDEGKSRREISRMLDLTVFQVFRIITNNKRRLKSWNFTTSIRDRRK